MRWGRHVLFFFLTRALCFSGSRLHSRGGAEKRAEQERSVETSRRAGGGAAAALKPCCSLSRTSYGCGTRSMEAISSVSYSCKGSECLGCQFTRDVTHVSRVQYISVCSNMYVYVHSYAAAVMRYNTGSGVGARASTCFILFWKGAMLMFFLM